MKKIIAMAVAMLPVASTAQTFNELWRQRAIASFEEVWHDRVTSEMQIINPEIEEAQPFDEEQYQHDKKIAAEKAAAKKPKSKKNKEDDDCLTLRQARKKYPHSRHYYWEDNHCWFG
jgi:hypothetical protein